MMGTELDELGEFDAEFVDNISKFEYTSIKYSVQNIKSYLIHKY